MYNIMNQNNTEIISEKTEKFCEHKWLVRGFGNIWSCTKCEEEWELEA